MCDLKFAQIWVNKNCREKVDLFPYIAPSKPSLETLRLDHGMLGPLFSYLSAESGYWVHRRGLLIADQEERLFVVTAQEEPVAFYVTAVGDPHCIVLLEVFKPYRRHGLGTRIVALSGCRRIIHPVDDAVVFWEKLGFRAVTEDVWTLD